MKNVTIELLRIKGMDDNTAGNNSGYIRNMAYSNGIFVISSKIIISGGMLAPNKNILELTDVSEK